MLGISSFIIPLLLSLKYDLGTKLSKGEVRKSIVIALTVMYIILLSLSFAGTLGHSSKDGIVQYIHYVYVIIIGFYFGSRLTEQIQTTKAYKNLKPLDILQKRYAMGEIDDATIDNMKQKVADLEILKLFEKKIDSYYFKEREHKLIQRPQDILIALHELGEIDDNFFDEMMQRLAYLEELDVLLKVFGKDSNKFKQKIAEKFKTK